MTSAPWAHESQREIITRITAWNRSRLGTFKTVSWLPILREAKQGGFQTGGFPTFLGKGPDCVADPFGTVPRRCCYLAEKEERTNRENPRRVPGKRTKKDKKGRTSRDWEAPPVWTPPRLAALDIREQWGRKAGLRFAGFVFLTFRGPVASHGSNPYPNRTTRNATNRVRAKGVVLCERTCFCLLSTFYETLPLRTLLGTLSLLKSLTGAF